MVSGPFPPADASGRSVVLGVGGGIAAYKVCELLRRFTESGHDVTVVPTESALKFVGAASWEALSGKPVHSDVFSDVPSVQHVRLGQQADLVFVAPATADLMAKAAHGRADDLLTSTLLTATCPVVYAPAMHTEMWQHPATRANVATLRARGALVLPPAHGRLTGADSGPGRLPEPLQLFELATNVLLASVGRAESGSAEDSCDQDGDEDDRTSSFRRDLQGRRVLVTAGGTREHLDPVRYLGNNSSGRQGFALAAAAVARGAEVTLVAANVEMSTPYGVTRRNVVSASELRDVVLRDSPGQHAVVMAAAPADYRPAQAAEHKIKKQPGSVPPAISLVENPDILAELVESRPGGQVEQVLVGFAAETGDDQTSALEHARAKLARKGCDWLVVNDVSAGAVFGSDENEAVIIGQGHPDLVIPRGSKSALAHQVWDLVASSWRHRL